MRAILFLGFSSAIITLAAIEGGNARADEPLILFQGTGARDIRSNPVLTPSREVDLNRPGLAHLKWLTATQSNSLGRFAELPRRTLPVLCFNLTNETSQCGVVRENKITADGHTYLWKGPIVGHKDSLFTVVSHRDSVRAILTFSGRALRVYPNSDGKHIVDEPKQVESLSVWDDRQLISNGAIGHR